MCTTEQCGMSVRFHLQCTLQTALLTKDQKLFRMLPNISHLQTFRSISSTKRYPFKTAKRASQAGLRTRWRRAIRTITALHLIFLILLRTTQMFPSMVSKFLWSAAAFLSWVAASAVNWNQRTLNWQPSFKRRWCWWLRISRAG